MSDSAGGPHDTVPVRPGEALNAASLTVWLHANAPELIGTSVGPIRVSQFGGGFSNLTYRVSVGEHTMVLRRPPRGVPRGVAHDMGREYRLLAALHPAGVPVPRALAFCDDDTVLGAPFYLMEFVDGVILRQAPPDGVRFDAHVASALAHAFVRQLVALHALDVDAIGLADLGRADGYVARQVGGWTKRWQASRTTEVRVMDDVAAWLAAHQPTECGTALLHNDFKYDNLVLDPADLTRVRAILDWEMATIGCPLMDLGTSLAYWVEASDPPLLRALGLGITAAPGSLSRSELVRAYEVASGREVADPVFYYVYGLFKLAVVAQQIYARHVRGLTSDPRFSQLDAAVLLLAQLAANAIDAQQLGRA
jgi:aminoglycoside phosphotransferase (APT) family kinase protein